MQFQKESTRTIKVQDQNTIAEAQQNYDQSNIEEPSNRIFRKTKKKIHETSL